MIDWILSLDAELFRFLNISLGNPVCDWLMPVVTGDWFLRALLLLLLLILLVFGRREGRVTALLCIIVVAASDQLSSHLLKPVFERIRPCHVVADVHLLVNCSSGLSFPSSHAANSFGQAVILAQRFPKQAWVFYVFAAIVSYSRIAVGVHYPLDILAGALVGGAAAITVYLAYALVRKRLIAARSGK